MDTAAQIIFALLLFALAIPVALPYILLASNAQEQAMHNTTIAVYPADYTEQELEDMYASIAQAFPAHNPDEVREAADFATVCPQQWQEERQRCIQDIAAHL